MVDKCIFHIGLHKTGTTFFQKEVFPKLNINYFELTKNHKCNDYLLRDNYYNIFYNRYVEFNLPNFFLASSEGLSGNPNVSSINRFNIINNIKFYFPKSKIILFLRRQDNYSKSLYLEYVKSGGSLKLKTIYQFVFKNYDRSIHHPNINLNSFLFYKYVDYIYNKFGKKNVLVIPFEKFCKFPDLVINDMCEFINCEVPEYNNKIINAKFGTFRILIHRFFNHFKYSIHNSNGIYKGIPVYLFKRKKWTFISFRGLLRKYGYLDKWDNFINKFDPPYKDKTGTCKKILEMCKEDNKKLDKKYKLGLKKYGYY